MSNTDRDLIAELADGLTRQSYSPVVVGNYCAYARGFLAFLAQHEIQITAVTPLLVAQYLRHAAVTFRKRRGRRPVRIGTRSRALESTHCCVLPWGSGRRSRT